MDLMQDPVSPGHRPARRIALSLLVALAALGGAGALLAAGPASAQEECEEPEECPEPQPTTTRLRLRTAPEKLVATGRVRPPPNGAMISVEVLRRDGAERRRLTGVRVVIDDAGAYRAELRRRCVGRCLVRASFGGTDDLLPSSATARFGCFVPRSLRPRAEIRVVPGTAPVSGSGPVHRFKVAVHRNLGVCAGHRFAGRVQHILYHDRSWGGGGRLGMRKVHTGDAALTVTLVPPRVVDRLCAPLATRGIYSCWNGSRAVINLRRWRNGAASFGNDLTGYRRYLINHEVGHGLGHGHRSCGGPGRRAPVMMQQTKGVGACRPNPWPLSWERGPGP